ncbi:MAG: efflux transporter outer membrane subunit [Verrucomicrobia bacterium]|nr:efflux transporter outer membrane subunit [Verrucomicrobiota bacterium]MBS0636256.1 efflux transporter outer membrane subunit [Verrucomicrobiota bacterium]
MKKLIYISYIAFCLPSCIQRYDAPPIPTPKVDAWKNEQPVTSKFADCPDPEQVLVEASFRPWWKVFGDDRLNELEYQAIAESPKVQGAVGRLEEAMAFYGITRASLFPEIDLEGFASRQRVSQSQPFAGAFAPSIAPPATPGFITKAPDAAVNPCVVCPPPPMIAPPTTATTKKPTPVFTSLGILPRLTYDLDFWGRNIQATESAMQQVKAEQEDLQNTLLQLTTAVADAYLQVRTYDKELEILNRTLSTRTNSYNLNKDQFDAGLINELAVYQAQSDMENVAAEIQNTSKLRSSTENRLAELVGQPASFFTLEADKDLPALPTVASGVPSTMLQQRPDIRQGLALIEAARLNVGVAKTEYFPDFTITLDYGFASNKANKLFKWKSRTWLTAVDMVMPLFTAGRISSTIDDAIAQYKQAVASYLDTVLIAFQQVEDSLFSIEATKRQLDHLKVDVDASQKAYDIAEMRYRMGLETYLTVVNTERTLLDTERIAIQVTREQYTNTIKLISSLGGYWENPVKEPANSFFRVNTL